MTPLERIEELKRKAHSSEDIEILTELMILRARIEGEGVYLECLNDRLQWNRYPEEIQDQSIVVAGRELGEAYRHTETQVFECAGLSHRIATFEHLKSGALLNLIPGGTYLMGSDYDEDEQPIHEVLIKPLLVGKYPVRQSEWDRIGGEDERAWWGEDLPIESVSWIDCKAWLKRASDCLRLLSESEWEYACQAGSGATFFWSQGRSRAEIDLSYCWLVENSEGRTRSVQEHSLKTNAFGLVDMLGNVLEWCEDAWLDNYKEGPYTHRPRNIEDPSLRVMRGACWGSTTLFCRSALRTKYSPDHRYGHQGFRLCRSLTE